MLFTFIYLSVMCIFIFTFQDKDKVGTTQDIGDQCKDGKKPESAGDEMVKQSTTTTDVDQGL